MTILLWCALIAVFFALGLSTGLTLGRAAERDERKDEVKCPNCGAEILVIK